MIEKPFTPAVGSSKFSWLTARRLALLPALTPLALGSLFVSLELGDPVAAQRYYIVFSILSAWVIYLPLRILLDRRSLGPWNVCDALVAFFAASTLLSVALSPDRFTSFHAAVPMLVFLSYYFLLSEIFKTVPAYPQVFALLLVTAGVVAIIGILQYFGIDLLPYTEERSNVKQVVLSTLGNPNFVASYIVPIIFLVPAAIMSIPRFGRQKFVLLIASALIFLLLTCLIMAGARGGWLAFIGTGSLLVVLYLLTRGKVPLGLGNFRISGKLVVGLAVALVLLISFLVVPNPIVKSRFDLAKRLTSTKEVRTRLFYWAVAGEMFARKPIFGIGYHRFSSSFWDEVVDMQKRDPRNLIYREYILRVPGRVPGQAHNEFIEIAAEQGLVGLTAFLGMLAWFFVRGGSIVASTKVAIRRRIQTLYLLAALLAVLIDGLFSFPLQLPASGLLFWTLLALLRQEVSTAGR